MRIAAPNLPSKASGIRTRIRSSTGKPGVARAPTSADRTTGPRIRIIQRIVKQVLFAVTIGALAVCPISASAAPSPSPNLSGLLVAPPSGYTQVTTAAFHGRFDATTYASQYQTKTLEAGFNLIQDGFVDGYGMTWVQRSTGHILLEFVIAFRGGKGAKSWLAYEEASDKGTAEYKHPDTLSGIGTYYGVHLAFTSSHSYADAFSFVKGNDMFGVGFVSPRDDVQKLAAAQTRSQYGSAPDQTIPKAQWPENAPSQRPQTNRLGLIIGAVLVLVLIAGTVRLVAVRRRH
jgi:hypothetical protein